MANQLHTDTILSLEDFAVKCEQGQRPECLVMGVGYVFWVSETLYFVAEGNIWSGKYRLLDPVGQIQANRNHWPVVTKTIYHLHVISPQLLQKKYLDAYKIYQANLLKQPYVYKPAEYQQDAIRPKEPVSPGYPGVKGSNFNPGTKELLELGANMDDKLGSAIGIVSYFKNIPYIGETLTTMAIVNDLDSGKYYDATGKSLLFGASLIPGVSPYVILLDLGIKLYNSESFITYQKAAATYEYMYLQYLKSQNVAISPSDEDRIVKKLDDADARFKELQSRKNR